MRIIQKVRIVKEVTAVFENVTQSDLKQRNLTLPLTLQLPESYIDEDKEVSSTVIATKIETEKE